MKQKNLKITNTLTGKKEIFVPRDTHEVRFYLCGMTVYDHCHLGHARSAIVFDTIRNYLEHVGWRVHFVKNFTDVDDKIIDRAKREGCDFQTIADRYIATYEKDMARLKVRPPTLAPKATDHIIEMIALISDQIKKGFAYEMEGDVYFEVSSFPAYGKLSGRNLEEMIAGGGGRVEVSERKKNPFDFALWKATKAGEPFWESPWGKGRPGWHIECSAMAMKHLGQTIDLHGGGIDLIFPHHENEIAQSESVTGEPFVGCWVHNGHVMIANEKMSKSLGNFFTIQEIFEKSGQFSETIIAEMLRFYLLSTHYRSPIDFSDAALSEAKAGLDHFYTLFEKCEEVNSSADDKNQSDLCNRYSNLFDAAMDDDFNTPEAIGILQQFRREVNSRFDHLQNETQQILSLFQKLGAVLGLFQVALKDWRYHEEPASNDALSHSDIEVLLARRNQARANRDFAMADQVRKELAKQGIILEDRPDGTTRVKR
ncbi:MAG: cysteine--tRNA ligase [Nitrospirota bacterium]